MAHFHWRATAFTVLVASAFATFALAQEASKSGQASSSGQSNSGTAQSSSSSSSNQGQNQASTNNDNSSNQKDSNAKSDNAQASRDSNTSQDQSARDQSKQDQSKQDQSNQNRDERSVLNSNADRNQQSGAREREDRGSARSDRDDRASSRDRSNRDFDRDTDRNRDRDDRNIDNRTRSDRESSREGTSRREHMRGPDVGIWFSRSTRDGLVISDVSTKGAIAKFGFREGDRIVSIDGRRITREDEFVDILLHSHARRVKVIVLRDNREETIFVEPALLVDGDEVTEVDPMERFGIILDDRYDDRVVVWRVIPRSPAFYAGFRPGDVIATFNGHPYHTRTEFERSSHDWKTGEVDVQVRRGERTRDLSVDVPSMERSDRRSARMERRDERTAQRESVNPTPDQGNVIRSDRDTNAQRDNSNRNNNTNRRGLLDRVRGNR